MSPTLIEGASPDSEISQTELFGPITCLYRVADFEQAVAVANDSPYGLTAAIHTASVHRSFEFMRRISAGVVSINGGTFGSEPHMPFGGVKASGNGLREPGTEALDVYSEWKAVHFNVDPTRA
jgi:aldehyde dehydrogenase (NAD+)